ncbi:MAG: nucleotidyltransferase domain-containing protein [Acetatifactor sp.]|nr:nucleotidyltransferase domain-containing protein [Acetatifactor sp.]
MMVKMMQEIKNILEKTPYFYCEICFIRGSLLTNEYNSNSDIDLLIISSDFKCMSYLKRRQLIRKTMKDMNTKIDVDAICLSTDEYMQLLYERRQMFRDERMERII